MPVMTPYARGVLAQEEPQGVLSGIGQGGLLYGIGAGIQNLRNRQPGQRPILDMLGNNAQSLLQAGIATLMAPTRRMAAQAWQQGMSSGSQVDAYRNKQRADERLQQQREQALATVMASLQEQGKIPAGMEGLAGFPEIAGTLITNAMKPPEDTRTDDMQEYDWAVANGYKGTPADWMRIRQPTTTIDARNMGNIPPGMEIIEEPGPNGSTRRRMVPIEGSPAARELAAEEQAAATRQQTRQQTADIVVQDIDRVLGTLSGDNQATAPSIFVTGPVGSLLSGIPGTPAADMARTLDTIKANVGFDRLQQMRDSSPTGGALGQVSEQENRLLQSVLGSLEQSQGFDQFQANLRRLRNVYLDIIHGPGQGPARYLMGNDAEVDRQYDALPPGAHFIGPDGKERVKPGGPQ